MPLRARTAIMAATRPLPGARAMSDPVAVRRDALLPTLRRALDLAACQARRVTERYPGYCPMYTVGGRWRQEPEHWTHWCEGFYPGIFWLLHKHTGEPSWRDLAERYSRALEPRRF